MGNGVMAMGPQLPRPSSTLPIRPRQREGSSCASSMLMTLEGVEPGPSSHPTRRWREMDSNFQFPVAKPRSASRHGGPSWLLGYGSGSVGDRRFESISLQRRESGTNRCAGKRTRAETWDLAGLAWRSADGWGPARGSARPLPFRKNDMLTGEPAGRRRRKQ